MLDGHRPHRRLGPTEPSGKQTKIPAGRVGNADQVGPAPAEEGIARPTVVPEELPGGKGERRDRQGEGARIGADEEIHALLSQKPLDVSQRRGSPAWRG